MQRLSSLKQDLFNLLLNHRLSPLVSYSFKAYKNVNTLDRPVFVIGLNRSGTSVTTSLLSGSNELLNWSEANEVWDPLGYPFETSKVKRPFWPIDPEGYTRSVLNSLPNYYLNSIPGIFSLYLATHSYGKKKRFLNKSPMNSTRVPLLNQLFPDAYYLSIVRDPRAVVRSWIFKIIPKLQKHSGSNVYFDEAGKPKKIQISSVTYSLDEMITAMAKSYNYIVTKQLDDLGSLPSDSVFFMRYEDFVISPRSLIRKIDFKFDLDHRKRELDVIPASLENRNIKYAQDLSLEEISLISTVCHPLMQKLGYEV